MSKRKTLDPQDLTHLQRTERRLWILIFAAMLIACLAIIGGVWAWLQLHILALFFLLGIGAYFFRFKWMPILVWKIYTALRRHPVFWPWFDRKMHADD